VNLTKRKAKGDAVEKLLEAMRHTLKEREAFIESLIDAILRLEAEIKQLKERRKGNDY
jgi:predicted  nucleic acid-binding Zn-ribbon protein